jgi:hypothetical protein
MAKGRMHRTLCDSRLVLLDELLDVYLKVSNRNPPARPDLDGSEFAAPQQLVDFGATDGQRFCCLLRRDQQGASRLTPFVVSMQLSSRGVHFRPPAWKEFPSLPM